MSPLALMRKETRSHAVVVVDAQHLAEGFAVFAKHLHVAAGQRACCEPDRELAVEQEVEQLLIVAKQQAAFAGCDIDFVEVMPARIAIVEADRERTRSRR